MRIRSMGMGALVLSVAGGLWACGNGDDSSATAPGGGDAAADAHPADASAKDASSTPDDATTDGGHMPDAAETGATDAAVPQRLLLSYNNYGNNVSSELVAFDMATKAVAGRISYTGFGAPYAGTSAPWLLEQENDVVAQLAPAAPWQFASSWNVADDQDAARAYTDPQAAIVVGTGNKAYVLPYNRNAIDVIDTSASVDGGTPIKRIDLSSELQAGGDGSLEITAGAYDPGRHVVYVLLANIIQATLACIDNVSPAVVAIDTNTDTLTTLSGPAMQGHGLALPGKSPAFGPGAMTYDAVGDRLLILQGGCTPASDDGSFPPPVGTEVDQLDLSTGAATRLLDLSNLSYLAQLVYVDSTHAFVQAGYGPYTTYAWNPTESTLGAAVPNAPDSFAWDGNGNLVGVSSIVDADSGATTGYNVVSVRVSDGNLTTLASNPFTLSGGGPNGALLWPGP
jgi:hypothetical protein